MVKTTFIMAATWTKDDRGLVPLTLSEGGSRYYERLWLAIPTMCLVQDIVNKLKLHELSFGYFPVKNISAFTYRNSLLRWQPSLCFFMGKAEFFDQVE